MRSRTAAVVLLSLTLPTPLHAAAPGVWIAGDVSDWATRLGVHDGAEFPEKKSTANRFTVAVPPVNVTRADGLC
jgi:hypothetical protein